jgi:hypothetical protein
MPQTDRKSIAADYLHKGGQGYFTGKRGVDRLYHKGFCG